jgi:hypothetical protein
VATGWDPANEPLKKALTGGTQPAADAAGCRIQAFIARWPQSFKEFPPRQKPGSFSIIDAMQALDATVRN